MRTPALPRPLALLLTTLLILTGLFITAPQQAKAGALTFGATDDTLVSSTAPTTTYGSFTTTRVDDAPKASLFKFDVTGIPAGATNITGQLTLTGSNDAQPSRSISVTGTATTWDESTVTWNTRPAGGTQYGFDTMGQNVVGTWSVPITGNGTVSYAAATSASGEDSIIATSEHATTSIRPKLVVNYTDPVSTTATDCTKFVATTGADTNAGTQAAPWRNVLESINKLTAGAVLCVQPGTYTQEVIDGTLPDGTSSARITVKSYDSANQALLDGKFSLVGLNYWTFRDLRFTNPTPTANNNVDARVVAFIDGGNVLFEDNEVFDSQYTGLLIGRSSASSSSWPVNYTVRGNYIHDTDFANFYFNPGAVSSGHVIERNIFANSGTENLKVGWGDNCTGYTGSGSYGYGAGGVDVLYNTMVNAGTAGNFVIAEPGGQHSVYANRNLMVDVDSARGFHVRYDSATATTAWPNGCLGDNAEVDNTWAYGTDPGTTTTIPFSEDFGDAPLSQGRESGTVTGTNPVLDANYVPTVTAAQAYGHAAP